MRSRLAATGLSKRSLYQTFGDKHRLFERYRERTGTAMATHLNQAESGIGFLIDARPCEQVFELNTDHIPQLSRVDQPSDILLSV